jgi:SAM-dependent methyltransferase
MRAEGEWTPTKIIKRAKGERTTFVVNEKYISPASLYITLSAFDALKECEKFLDGHLVDLGAGDVPYYLWYRDHVDRITCVDWPITSHARKHIDFFADLNSRLPMENAMVDTVLLTSVLEHIRKPNILLSEICRVLRPHGHLILGAPFLYHLHEEPHDYYRYTEHAIKDMAEASGFSISHICHYGSAAGVITDIVGKVLFTLTQALANRMPSGISKVINSFAAWLVKKYQRISFNLMRSGLLNNLIADSYLDKNFPLGYIAVLTKDNEFVQFK